MVHRLFSLLFILIEIAFYCQSLQLFFYFCDGKCVLEIQIKIILQFQWDSSSQPFLSLNLTVWYIIILISNAHHYSLSQNWDLERFVIKSNYNLEDEGWYSKKLSIMIIDNLHISLSNYLSEEGLITQYI